MSDAIEFGIGGNNKGFVAVLNDSEKKAKESGAKVTKEFDKVGSTGLKGKAKIVADLDGIAGEFARVTTVSGGLEAILSKVGGGLKMAGAVGVAIALGKAIYDTAAGAMELDLAMQRINRSSNGGVANFDMSKLHENLDTIKKAREENKKEIDGISSDWLKAASATIGEALSRTGAEFTGAEVLSPSEREDKLRAAEEKALERIAEKNKEIFAIERQRLLGNKEGADLMAVEAAYAEKIQSAISARNTDEQKRLGAERDDVVGAMKRQQEVALAQRVTLTATAAGRAGNAGRAIGMSAQDELRQNNDQRVIEAGMEYQDAQKASNAMPGDKDLAAKVEISARNLETITAENAKWERDIARSKADSLKTIDAEIDASKLTMQGRTVEADLLVKKVANELAATKAIREGNDELSKRITKQGELQIKQDKFNRSLNPETGRLRTEGERVRSVREQRITRRSRERDQRRFDRNDGLLNVRRGSAGQIISGVDGDLNQRVNVSGSAPTNALPSASSPSIDFAEALRPRGAGAMLARQGLATTEMNFKKEIADVGMTRAQRRDAIETQKIDAVKSGTASPEQNLSRIAQVLESWNG